MRTMLDDGFKDSFLEVSSELLYFWKTTLPETNIAPESLRLEDEFPFGTAYFQVLHSLLEDYLTVSYFIQMDGSTTTLPSTISFKKVNDWSAYPPVTYPEIRVEQGLIIKAHSIHGPGIFTYIELIKIKHSCR